MADKKEFAWDSEFIVNTFVVSEHDTRELKICTLNGKEFVVLTQLKHIKGEWKPVKNSTIPKSIWAGIVNGVDNYDKAVKTLGESPAEVKEKLRKGAKAK